MFGKIKNFLFVVLPVFLILHFFGWYRFYYDLAGYDKVVHFFAGTCVVLMVLWFLDLMRVKKVDKRLVSLIVLFFVSFIWEVLEYLVDHVFSRPLAGLLQPMQLNSLDTLGDFLADFAGGFLVLILVHFKGKNG